MERLFPAAKDGTARAGARFALLRLTLLFALLLGAVWSNAAMATIGCEIQPVGGTFKSGAPGSNVTFDFNIVSITGGCGPSVSGTVLAGTDTTGGASAAPVSWAGAPGSTITITVTLGPTGGGQAAYTIKCSADCFNGNTSIPITAMVNDTYVLTPNSPTTVTALEQTYVPLSVTYLVNGAASTQDTAWVVDQPTSSFLTSGTVTPDASGNADNSFYSFAAGTYVVTVSGGCPTAVPGCPPPPVNFTLNVEHPAVAIVAPAGGTATVVTGAPLNLEISYRSPSLNVPDGKSITWFVSSEPAPGAGTFATGLTSTTNGLSSNTFTGSAPGVYVLTAGYCPDGCASTVNFTITVANPAMSVDKVYLGFTDNDGTSTPTQGDLLSYTVTATNTGDLTLTGVTVSDAQLTPGSTSCASVAVGAICKLTGTHVITAADASTGNVTNTGTANSNEVGPVDSNTVVVPVNTTSGLSVTKTFDGFTDNDGTGTVTQGDVLNYTLTARNTGNAQLTGMVLSDPQLSPGSASCATVAVGASCVLSGSHTVTPADASAGNVTNTGSATANEIGPINSNTVVTPINGSPGMSVVKSFTGFTDNDSSGSITQGDALNYTVNASNSGNVTLTSVTVSDAKLTPGSAACASVAAGGNCVLTGSHVVTAADISAGNVTNTASATSKQVGPVNSNTVVTPVSGSPAMSVVKSFTGFTDNDSSGSITQGDALNYSINASNSGNVTLTSVTVSDAQLTPGSAACASVATGGNCVLTGSHTVTAGDVSTGNVTNTASATSRQVGPVNSNTVVTPVNGSPALNVTKVFTGYSDNDGTATVSLGDTLNYAITANNAGNITLTSVTVSDAQLTPGSVACASVATGGSCVLTGSHTVTAGDVSTGNVTNTASATSRQVGPVSSNTVVTPVQRSPTLTITSGDGQSGLTNTVADLPLVVSLRDGAGAPIAGRTIVWSLSGPGTVSASSTPTDAAGQARVTLTFGATAGSIKIIASTSGGVAPVTFSATSVNGSIGIASGDGQTGPINTRLPLPLKVKVNLPAFAAAGRIRGEAFNGVPVTFTVTSGGGSMSSTTVFTDALGEAASFLTLGPVPGTQTVRASIPGGGNVSFTATATLIRTLTIVSGNGQTAAPGNPLPSPLVVRAQDNGGNVAGVGISWTVISGSATASPAAGSTDTAGQTSTRVTLGASPGTVTVRAARVDDPAINVLFTSSVGTLQLTPGLSPDQRALAVVLDGACSSLAGRTSLTPAQADLFARCSQLIGASLIDPSATANALDQLLPGLAAAAAESTFNAAQSQFQNLKTRIAALRSGTQGSSFSGLALTAPGGTISLGSLALALAGDDQSKPQIGADFQRWGFFASGNIGRGAADPSGSRPAYDYNIDGLTAGVDYRQSDKFIFGAAVGITRQSTDLAGAPGSMDMRGWSVSSYATYYRDNSWYSDAVLTWGSNKFDLLRSIHYTVPLPGGGSSTIDQTARSSSNGDMFEGAFTFGRDFQVQGWSIGAYGRMLYTKVNFDRISEHLGTGVGSGLGLEIDARSLTSVASQIGTKFTYAHSTSWGVVTPHLQLEWEHEFKDDPQALTARFLADPSNGAFNLSSGAVDSDYFKMSLGLSMIMAHGRSGFLIYEHTLGRSGFSQDNLGFGVRIEF